MHPTQNNKWKSNFTHWFPIIYFYTPSKELFIKNQFLFFSRLNLYIVHTLLFAQIHTTTTNTKNNIKAKNMDDSFEDFGEVVRTRTASQTCWHMHKQISKSSQTFSECVFDAFTKGKSSRTVKKNWLVVWGTMLVANTITWLELKCDEDMATN